MTSRFEVQIYYEDTDHSGVVYHANYLKYFERAREHMLGTAELRRLLVEDGIGFVVYKAELTYKKGAVFGDTITIETRADKESPYRAVFHQTAKRGAEVLVEGKVELVCVGRDEKLVTLPASAVAAMEAGSA
ncbi:MAG: YbgC/FadM family acyl-CoA thioesterase [Sandaracinaceae bacterium]|nr:YbgC/FadM family acyl-CoA thioesterase [Sandaracinaceae bacterium]